MSNPKSTRTERATEADQRDPNIGGDQPAANTTEPEQPIDLRRAMLQEIDQSTFTAAAADADPTEDEWRAMDAAERAAWRRQETAKYMTEHAFFALLHNPRFEQIARLPAADAARHGAGLYDYASRLVDGFLNAQEYAK